MFQKIMFAYVFILILVILEKSYFTR